MNNILLIIFPNQLFDIKYIEKILNYNEDNKKINKKIILLWEHEYFFTKFPYHKIKLTLHRCSMKKYYDDLPNEYDKKYIELIESNKIMEFIKKNSINQIRYFNPIEKELLVQIQTNQMIKQIENIIFQSPYFLNSSDFTINDQIDKTLSTKRHDLFYKNQRIRYNIMVSLKSNKYIPTGSKWSFDTENRNPFNKDQVEPKLLKLNNKKRDDYIEEAIKYVNLHFTSNYGTNNKSDFIYPIDSEECSKWLDHFVATKLENFGKFEDALSSKIKFGYHSLLSPLTNIGLITPIQIINKIICYKKNIASKEAFIRQIIGWREYCYFVYDKYYQKLKTTSMYKLNKRKIPQKVWNSNTLIPPIDNILLNLKANGYSHHIERLMGIGNFLTLIGVDTDEIYKWFQTMYIDAYDVFMIPNIYGMLSYGKLNDRTHMLTRPYICSSNYLLKMSDYKSSKILIDGNEYKWTEILDALYYFHINNYLDIFSSIYSTAPSAKRWKLFDNEKKKKILELASCYIGWLYKS